MTIRSTRQARVPALPLPPTFAPTSGRQVTERSSCRRLHSFSELLRCPVIGTNPSGLAGILHAIASKVVARLSLPRRPKPLSRVLTTDPDPATCGLSAKAGPPRQLCKHRLHNSFGIYISVYFERFRSYPEPIGDNVQCLCLRLGATHWSRSEPSRHFRLRQAWMQLETW
jgi:hypothetical protein